MAYAPFRQYWDPNWKGGSFYIVDVFGGFQIFRDVESKIFMNAQIGYRRINYDNNGINITNQGITTRVNYSQVITHYLHKVFHLVHFFRKCFDK